MKVTVRFDEAAAMTPSEVKVRQMQAETVRERNRQWNEAERGLYEMMDRSKASALLSLGIVWPNGGDK